ncbi:MAG: RNA polymerase sigma-70 factor [Mediterranea sp.]|nr:RNA polymerase sigma-70 factor [Mediterranea sp.]
MFRFSEFFQENREKFLAFAYSYTRNRAEAEDILMESVIALWESRDRWEEGKSLHALLLTVIKNKALNLLEKEQTHLRIEEEIHTHRRRELDLRIATLKECEPDALFSADIQRIVTEALSKMSPQSRKIFTLSRIDNLSNQHIATQMNVSVKTVEYHITKTLQTLRTALKDYLHLFLL